MFRPPHASEASPCHPSRSWPTIVALTVTLAAVPATASLGPPIEPLVDVRQVPFDPSSRPIHFFPSETRAYFLADSSEHGREPWRTDGTVEGTRLVVDFCPGECSESLRFLGTLGDRLFFSAGDDLWITDGTDAGTTRLVRTDAGNPHAGIFAPTVVEGRLVFRGSHPDYGTCLWVSDGTAEGTAPIPFSFDEAGPPDELTTVGDLVYFYTRDLEGTVALWRTDGTLEGTQEVRQICAECGHSPSRLTPFGDRLFFSAYTPETGYEPWLSDGTPEGTRMLADLEPGTLGSHPKNLTTADGTLYGTLAGDCFEGDCLLRSDGTPEGTRRAPELLPAGASGRPIGWTVAGSTLYLLLTSFDEQQLWAVGGPGGVAEIVRGNSVSIRGTAHGSLYFSTFREEAQRLHVTAGTPQTTRELAPVEAFGVTTVGSRAIFQGLIERGPLDDEHELWVSDGTTEGTGVLVDLRPATADSNPTELVAWGEGLVFQTRHSISNLFAPRRALWHFDGQGASPLLEDYFVVETVVAQDQLYAVGTRPEMWVFERDGTGQRLDLAGRPSSLTPFRDRLYLAIGNPSQQLWRTDGTEERTEMLLDVNPEWRYECNILCPGLFPDDFPNELTPLGERILFVAFENDLGPAQLWISDDTAEGAHPVREFEMDPDQGITPVFHSPDHLTPSRGLVYFIAFHQPTGRELWLTDGTSEGTRPVADLAPGPASSELLHLQPWDHGLVFVRRTADGDELWRADADGAERVFTFEEHAVIHESAPSEGLVYLAVDTTSAGRELWVSNGTAQGTRLFDLRPEPGRSSGVRGLTPVPGGVFFGADAGDGTGHEPWISRGTPASTRRLADLYPGPTPSSPGPGIRIGNRLYFAARHPEIGREPFVLDLDAVALPDCPETKLCLSNGRFEVSLAWSTADGASGDARRVASEQSSGLMWFFDDDNWEAMVKVLDGCADNNHYWVFAALSTNAGYTLTVEDVLTGTSRTYEHPAGEPAAAVTDTEALAVCP